MTERLILIDCDAGTDDVHAILMALEHPDVRVLAVTAVAGNASVEHTTSNVLRVLKAANRLDVPVHKGSGTNLIGAHNATGFHGKDGLGDVTMEGIDPIDVSLVQSEPAASAIVRLSNQHPGEITLVTLGPLTNIAIAVHLDPDVLKRFKQIIIMGGNSKGVGNVTLAAEFNFWYDPEAAHVVLSRTHHCCPLPILATWEACSKYGMSWDYLDSMMSRTTPQAAFLKQVMSQSSQRERHERHVPRWTMMCDALTMAVALDREVVDEITEAHAQLETAGNLCRGAVVMDWKGAHASTTQPCNVNVMMAVNKDKLQSLLSTAF